VRGAPALLLAAAVGLTAASGAAAQVFEVGADGSMARAGQAVAADTLALPEDEPADVGGAPPPLPEAAVTPAASTGAPVPAAFRSALVDAASRYQLSPELLAALVWQESRWQPGAVSRKGAVGLAQLMPATARTLAVDPRDGAANLGGAARYLRQLLDLFDGDVERALAAYNAGPARVLKAGGVPAIAETRGYVATIIDHMTASAGAAR
jgi:soluble lytic murein transglycosylase-like protein